MKACIVPMIPRRKGKAFDLIIYGRTAEELMTVPNEVVQSLARRYPDHTSNIFLIYTIRRDQVERTK